MVGYNPPSAQYVRKRPSLSYSFAGRAAQEQHPSFLNLSIISGCHGRSSRLPHSGLSRVRHSTLHNVLNSLGRPIVVLGGTRWLRERGRRRCDTPPEHCFVVMAVGALTRTCFFLPLMLGIPVASERTESSLLICAMWLQSVGERGAEGREMGADKRRRRRRWLCPVRTCWSTAFVGMGIGGCFHLVNSSLSIGDAFWADCWHPWPC